MVTIEERLAKAGKEFKRLDADMEALKLKNVWLEGELKELRGKYDKLEGFLKKKHTDMMEVFQWYLKRLMEETDGTKS